MMSFQYVLLYFDTIYLNGNLCNLIFINGVFKHWLAKFLKNLIVASHELVCIGSSALVCPLRCQDRMKCAGIY